MSVDGADKLCKQFDRMAESSSKNLCASVMRAGKFVQGNAKMLVPVGESGNLREKIFTKTENGDGFAKSEIYTDEKYGPFVELGTGPKGAGNHGGISPNISPAYTMSPWWIHESQIDKELAEKYHWFYIETKEGRFYQCTGQPAQPYLYPALANNRDAVADMIKTGTMKGIKESL